MVHGRANLLRVVRSDRSWRGAVEELEGIALRVSSGAPIAIAPGMPRADRSHRKGNG